MGQEDEAFVVWQGKGGFNSPPSKGDLISLLSKHEFLQNFFEIFISDPSATFERQVEDGQN